MPVVMDKRCLGTAVLARVANGAACIWAGILYGNTRTVV